MGITEKIRERRTARAVTAAMTAGGTADPSTFPISSPWSSSSDLQRIVFDDIFGTDAPINTRAAALKIPPLKRARDLVVTTIARNPLRVYDDAGTAAAVQPGWLYRTNQATSPQLRLAWTVDDLLFYGWSCWWRRNDADGYPTDVGRVNYGNWTLNDDNRVEINGQVQSDEEVTLIPGLHAGILTEGSQALDDTRMLYRNVRARLLNPSPQLNLQQTAGAALTTEQIDDLILRWSKARQGENGGVGFSSTGVEPKEMGGSDDAKLMIESRNAAAVDMARLVGVSAGRLDATTPKASLNYETTTGRNQELVDFDLELHMLPITARLSLDDLVPPTQHVAFDLTDFQAAAPSVSGPQLAD